MNPLEQLKSMRAEALKRLEASADYKLVHALQPLIEELESASGQETDEDGEAAGEPASFVDEESFEVAENTSADEALGATVEVAAEDDLGGSIEEALEMAMTDAVSETEDTKSEAEIDFEAVKAQLMEAGDEATEASATGNGYDKSYS